VGPFEKGDPRDKKWGPGKAKSFLIESHFPHNFHVYFGFFSKGVGLEKRRLTRSKNPPPLLARRLFFL